MRLRRHFLFVSLLCLALCWGPSAGFLSDRLLQGAPPIASEIGILLAGVAGADMALIELETTLQVRFTQYYVAMSWNCIAAYSSTLKDTLTKERPAVVVTDVTLHETSNRALCAAQAWQTFSFLSFDLARDPIQSSYESINVTVEDSLDDDVAGCNSDTVCLHTLAEEQNFAPRIMGHIIGKLVSDYGLTDGYNQLGTDGGCVVNCRPYSDPTGYEPVDLPYRRDSLFRGRRSNRWKPLLEDNGNGFFFIHEHVTPHIGQRAKFRVLPETDRTDRVAEPPQYSRSRRLESNDVIDRMATLDDTKKIQIEAFDNKLVEIGALFASFVGKLLTDGYTDDTILGKDGLVLSYERLIHFADGLLATDYDCVVIAWKEKVKYDLIRPTTVIKERRDDENITTWAPGGIQTFPATDFEAYIRVMPHSEYVSGSACIFQGQQDYILAYMDLIGLNPTFPVQFPTVFAGESKVEPGLVPSEDLTLTYPDIETMAAVGGQSRLDGGMHFEASVPGARALCSGIGTIAVDNVVMNIE